MTVPLTILGQGEAVLDGSGAHEVLTLRADGITVRGLTIRNVGSSFTEDRAGIRLDRVRRCAHRRQPAARHVLRDLRRAGRRLRAVGNVLEAHGTRQTATGNGIHLFASEGFTVVGNRIRGHRDGIYLEFFHRATILANDSRGNLRYGLHFMYSDSCAYRRNVFAANGVGVAVMYSRSVTMTGNRFEHNWGPAAYGLLLKEIKDSRIEDNVLARNTVGLLAEGVDRPGSRATSSWATAGRSGLMADRTEKLPPQPLRREHVRRGHQQPNQQPSTFAENYWDAYVGYDLDRDGFGDVPFPPVRLFSVLVEQNEPLLILLPSFFSTCSRPPSGSCRCSRPRRWSTPDR